MRTLALTSATLVAFAANSILCRLALGSGAIDGVSFTAIRLGSGAALLAILVAAARGRWMRPTRRVLLAAFALFAYAILFSLAYRTLHAGTGALLLFGATQATMIGTGLVRGERPRAHEWIGWGMALAGLVLLSAPGLLATRGEPWSADAALMLIAGVAWGTYSLLGRGVPDPVAATATNFVVASVPALAWAAFTLPALQITSRGVWLATASGALASGVGYVIWYAALRGLTRTRAAIVQLAVPILAAIAGVLLLSETVAWRLVASGALILGGVAIATAVRARERS